MTKTAYAFLLCLSLAARTWAADPEQQTFTTPEEAAVSLIAAAERYDVEALKQIFGPEGVDLVVTADKVQSENNSHAFAEQARVKYSIVRDPTKPKLATLVVGPEDWPTPIPLVERGGRWSFDTQAGRLEVLRRRIGRNELDAIEICYGYVEAQNTYALQKHEGSRVNEYARRIVSTPGKQDGLAWRTADGKWEGPISEGIAHVIAEGYTSRAEPYHGYFFKILKGQGPSAPLGKMDFIINGAMIGGFALAAAPADYGVTGIKSFIVSHDGVVYEKDMGPKTLELFQALELFDPDRAWSPVSAP